MRLFSLVVAAFAAFLVTATSSVAATAYGGFYVGAVYISFSGSISIPEYSAGGVAITVDGNGRLTSTGDLSGSVDNSGVVTFNPGNSSGFTTGAIDNLGNLSATSSRTANGVTTTLRLAARNIPPGYGASGTLAGRLTQHHPAQDITGMNDVTFTGSRFVAVGDRGAVAFSDDGLNWTRFGLPTTVDMVGIAAKVSVRSTSYVAVGDSGARFYSLDGNNWTARGGGVSPFSSVAAGNGVFVGVDIFGSFGSSPDGNVWTGITVPIAGGTVGYPKLKFVNGRFVAANNTQISFSTDGATWTTPVTPGVGQFNTGTRVVHVAHGNNLWVAAGHTGFATSADGTTWTKVAQPAVGIDSLSFGGGVFVAHDYGDNILASTNGTTWQIVGRAPDFNGIAYGKGRFVVASRELWTSTNGFIWTAARVSTMDTPQPYVGRSTRPQDGPYGFAPVVGSANGGNIGQWWYGHNGYMYYFQNTFSNLFGELPPITDATLRTFVGDPAYYGLFAGDNGTIIYIRSEGGFNPPKRVLTRPATSGDLLAGTGVGTRPLFVGSLGAIVIAADNTLTNYIAVPSGTTETLRQVHHFTTANGLQTPTNIVIAVGDKGTVLTSPNGLAWVKRTLPTTEDLVGATFLDPLNGKPGRILVYTKSGAYLETTNLATWKAADLPQVSSGPPAALPQVESLAFGNGRWVGLGQDFTAASTDSFTWNRRPTLGGLRQVAFGNGRFVALSTTGVSGTSTDGLQWTIRTNLPAQMNVLAFGGGRFVAAGAAGKTAFSTDGLTWTEKASGATETFTAITYANGKFVAVGQGGSITSADGETWTRGGTFTGQSYAVAGGNGVFVTAGANGYYSYSTNGSSWTQRRTAYRGPINSYPEFKRAAYANGVFYLTAGRGELFTSTNGVDFVENFTGLPFTHVDGVAVANGRLMFANAEIHSILLETAGLPAFTSQPQNASVPTGATATFSAAATGSGALSYQWFKDGTPLVNDAKVSGATSATLTISGATLADAGSYYLVAANEVGGSTSTSVTLTVQAPPQITIQPASLTLIQGSNAAFSVRATGPGPFTYQWRKGGVNLTDGGAIAGATGPTLIITGAQSPNAGSYDVVISNAFGSSTSVVANLVVEGPPTAPILVAQPQPVTVNVGETITLSFNVRGAQPMQFNWFREDQVTLGGDPRITGQATSTLTINNAKGTDSAVYYAVAANSLGFLQSAKVRVTVLGDIGFRQDFTFNPQGSVSEIIRLSDDEFILAGAPTVRDGNFVLQYVVKIDGKGAPIKTFAGTRPTTSVATIEAVADGKYVVGGQFQRWGTDTTIQYLARIQANGEFDPSFVATPALTGVGPNVVKIVALADGKLLVGRSGSSSQNSLVTRYNANGSADASFAEMNTFRSTITDLAVQANGTIWASGSFGLKKLNADGSNPVTVVNTATGKLWVGPNQELYYAHGVNLKRLKADGSPDNAFNVTVNNSGRVGAVAFLPDGRLLIGGDFFDVNNTRREKMAIVSAATGQVDTSFTSPYPGGVGALETFALLGDGSVLVGGSYAGYLSQSYVQRVQLTRPTNTGGGNQTLAQWSASKGLTAGVNDGAQQDPDNDGLSNLAEFVLGTNPLAAAADQRPKATTAQVGAETHAALQFTRNKAATGATIQVTASNSLSAGAAAETVTETVEDIGNGLERVTVRATKPLSQVTKLFFHVKVGTN
ncbi:MAG TPA: immunoglobulin domain-containing protein [Methylomirabilota bacterium]|nr:immunoglobulin domain-containing protein [Methylomirabilota bacterium]